ncbi:MAG: MFS transporter [Acholeplasmataceae bacterium]
MAKKQYVLSTSEVTTKERLSFAFTNFGQTMIYGLIVVYLMIYMTDYLAISAAIAGIILGSARIFDAINDPLMGAILDKTNTRFGKCRPYMLFTPIPLAIITLLMFAPFSMGATTTIIYASITYLVFTIIYTANDIPFWSMSSVMTTKPEERVKIVTTTRLIGGFGAMISVGLFWTINKMASDAGLNPRMSFFIAVSVFVFFGTILLLQGFFNTKERAKNTAKSTDKLLDNLKLVPKSKPLVINIIAGMLMSITMIGSTAMTTYFVKWNIMEVFPNMSSNDILSIYTPIIGILPSLAMIVGLVLTPFLVKKFEKRNLLLLGSIFGILANIVFYFVGYDNIYLFVFGRFLAFLPLGMWISVTTLMIGDSVDEIEHRTGKRVEGTAFSLLTFVGKFQNGINVALTGFILSMVGYVGTLNPDVAQQSAVTLKGIFIMVTLVPALGYLVMGIPFIFYDFSRSKHQDILDDLKKRALTE